MVEDGCAARSVHSGFHMSPGLHTLVPPVAALLHFLQLATLEPPSKTTLVTSGW